MLSYRIKKSDANFIQALVKYCKDISICTIEEDDRQTVRNVDKKNYTCKDLPSLLPTIQGDEFFITCNEYVKIKDIFPVVDTHKLMAGAPKASNDERSILDANIFDSFFAGILGKSEGGADGMYVDPTFYSKDLVKIRPRLNKTETILLLQQINEKYPVTNVFFLPQQETFIFQVNRQCYYLRFGKPKFDELGLVIDMSQGFKTSMRGDAERLAFIVDGLNGYFNEWKDGGYIGDLFTAKQTGLDVEEVRPALQAAASTDGFFAPSADSIKRAPQQAEPLANKF